MTVESDINILKDICTRLEDNYFDDEWNLSEHEEDELYRITGFEEHDWDDSNLAHFIDGMQRTLHLLQVYDSHRLNSKGETKMKKCVRCGIHQIITDEGGIVSIDFNDNDVCVICQRKEELDYQSSKSEGDSK